MSTNTEPTRGVGGKYVIDEQGVRTCVEGIQAKKPVDAVATAEAATPAADKKKVKE